MNDESALQELVADETELNKGLLFDILAPYVRIGNKTGSPMFTPEFGQLTNPGKIMVLLLTRKAAISLGLSKSTESATPTEISGATGIPYDSVKPTVSELARKHVLVRDSGRYYYPNHLILQARELIK